MTHTHAHTHTRTCHRCVAKQDKSTGDNVSLIIIHFPEVGPGAHLGVSL